MNGPDNTVLSKKRKSPVDPDIFSATSTEKNTKTLKENAPQFVPHSFLQCHGSGDDTNDFSQQVWCCKFQPNSTDIVATCGGESICLIDANSARVKGRFLKPSEEFYTLDWTVFETGAFSSNVLACGGCLGFVYLIHAEQFCVYGFFKAHTKPVQTMHFMPNNPDLLLTAGNEKKIYLWDIGTLSLPEYHFNHKKLALFENLPFSPLKMVTLRREYILCASEGGLFCWHSENVFKHHNGKKVTTFQRISDITEIEFLFVDAEPLVDGLAVINEDLIATKCVQVGVIFLWKPSSILHKIRTGCLSVTALITQELKWSNTQQCYINIAACQKYQTLFAGDDKGSIWIYDCATYSSKSKSTFSPNKLKDKSSLLAGKPQPVAQIMRWPICRRNNQKAILSLDKGTVLNDICCSDDMKFLVVAADNNLVCIYKLAD